MHFFSCCHFYSLLPGPTMRVILCINSFASQSAASARRVVVLSPRSSPCNVPTVRATLGMYTFRGDTWIMRAKDLLPCCGCRLSSASARMRNDADVRFPVCYRTFLAIYFCDRTIGFFLSSVDKCIVRMVRSFFSESYFNSRARLLIRALLES